MKTEQIAEQTYVDPSALIRLYLHHEYGSTQMVAWRKKAKGTLTVTHHGQGEMVNAIALAVFRGDIKEEDAKEASELLQSDFANGHLSRADLLWRSALNRAPELSREHTPRLGTRSLDVLHVACALELKLPRFLSFDDRQQALASGVGLRLIRL